MFLSWLSIRLSVAYYYVYFNSLMRGIMPVMTVLSSALAWIGQGIELCPPSLGVYFCLRLLTCFIPTYLLPKLSVGVSIGQV